MEKEKITKYDEGLGTIYERVKLYDKLDWLIKTYKIKSVLEGPIDGITGIKGINSLIFAKSRIPATVVLPEQEQIDYAKKIARNENCANYITYIKGNSLAYARDYYDLVWNLHAISLVEDQQLLFSQMSEKSGRYVLILENNRLNYGFLFHKLYHLLVRDRWKHGNPYWMKKSVIRQHIQSCGLKILLEFFVDSPWWPDIDDLNKISRLFKSDNHVSGEQCFFYFNKDNELKEATKRLSFIENSSYSFIKPVFSHIFGILAEKQ